MEKETDEEIKQNNEKYNKIKQQVFKAFAGVKLGDGIGFYEAGAIDDYLTPNDADYQEEKARDEREDWTKVFDMLEAYGDFDQGRHSFMDAKGQHFYMPIILLLSDIVSQESVLMPSQWRPEVHQELMQLFSIEQKQAIIDCFAYDVNYENSIEYYENFKGIYCNNCKTIHPDPGYTKEEAKEEVESQDEYKLWMYLRNEFDL
jgi:hypothetical protein